MISTILLVAEAETVPCHDVLTPAGEEQVAKVAKFLEHYGAPSVILGTHYAPHRVTADALQRRVNPGTEIIDWSVGGSQAYYDNASDPAPLLGLLRSLNLEGRNVVLVTLYDYAQKLMQTAGLNVVTYRRGMRSTTAYPVQMTSSGRLSPTTKFTAEMAADLTTTGPRPDMYPRD